MSGVSNDVYAGEQLKTAGIKVDRWEDLSIEQKLEALREVAVDQAREIARLHDRVAELQGHEHGADGTPMISVRWVAREREERFFPSRTPFVLRKRGE